MSYKIADVVHVKVTGETGFVLQVKESDVPFFSQLVLVRLPLIDREHGIQHNQKVWFYSEELENPKERIQREFALQLFEYELREQYRQSKKKTTPNIADILIMKMNDAAPEEEPPDDEDDDEGPNGGGTIQ